MRDENDLMDVVDDESPVGMDELQGQEIEIDATNLEVFQLPELMTEVLVTMASMISEETGAEINRMSGDISTTKGKALTDQSGDFSQVYGASLGDTGYELRLHGTWSVAEHETIDEDDESAQMVTRMTINVTIDTVTAVGK